VNDLETHARIALEQVCARGDLNRARALYAEDWTVSDNLELLRRLGPLRRLPLAARGPACRLTGVRARVPRVRQVRPGATLRL
jgi:hypothetical protein